VVLFVVLKDEKILTQELSKKINEKIRIMATLRHVPSKIYQVNDIPRTISGKKVEIAVTKIINGEPIENKDALANPASLEQYKKIAKQNN
jgi:acetoacetyl-CoA synthetase